MPTLSTHVSDELAAVIAAAAGDENNGKISPWIGEACRQRAEREGLIPATEEEKAHLLANALIAKLTPVGAVKRFQDLIAEEAGLAAVGKERSAE